MSVSIFTPDAMVSEIVMLADRAYPRLRDKDMFSVKIKITERGTISITMEKSDGKKARNRFFAPGEDQVVEKLRSILEQLIEQGYRISMVRSHGELTVAGFRSPKLERTRDVYFEEYYGAPVMYPKGVGVFIGHRKLSERSYFLSDQKFCEELIFAAAVDEEAMLLVEKNQAINARHFVAESGLLDVLTEAQFEFVRRLCPKMCPATPVRILQSRHLDLFLRQTDPQYTAIGF